MPKVNFANYVGVSSVTGRLFRLNIRQSNHSQRMPRVA